MTSNATSATYHPGPLVGTREPQIVGRKLVTGAGTYVADVTLPGATHLVLVRSPHPHARIRAVDAARASAARGVVRVVTGDELRAHTSPVPHYLDPTPLGGRHADVWCLAVGRVLYAGQPVAAVVAETPHDAEAAAALVEVEYEQLPFVLDAASALTDDAPRLYEGWDGNVILRGVLAAGDVEAAFAAADGALRETIRIQRSSAAPLEPRAYQASWDAGTGRLTLYATTQNPHTLRGMLAESLGVREADIRVVAPQLGGAFGLKMPSHVEETLVCALSRLVGRPVRWIEDRRECFLVGGREQSHEVEVAYDRDGVVRGLRDRIVANVGAVSALPGWAMTLMAAFTLPCAYRVDDIHVEYAAVTTNKPPWNAQRGFGKEAANFVMERVMDLVARATGLDPAEVRRRNLVGRDELPRTIASGFVLDSGDYRAVLDEALGTFGYEAWRAEQVARTEGPRLGIGMAFELMPEGGAIPGVGGGFDSATVRMSPSGDVIVLTGVTNPGGGNDTAIAQLVAGELGISPGDVAVLQGDTDACPFGFGNGTGRSVITGGTAAALAARELASRLVAAAQVLLQVGEDVELELRDGVVRVVGQPELALPLPAVARAVVTLSHVVSASFEPSLEVTRVYKLPHVRHLPDELGRINPYPTYANAAYVALVEVDVETGVVSPRRVAVCHDCGTVVNPLLVEGQVHGGVAMGIGSALLEESVYTEDGLLAVTSFADYLAPRAGDVPEIAVTHRETPSPYTLLGTKGAGEAGLAGAQAAIAAAVEDALAPFGVVVRELPLSPPRILDLIEEAGR